MFEARIVQGSQLKKIIEAIRELVVDANLDCDAAGITMQVKLPSRRADIITRMTQKRNSFYNHNYFRPRQAMDSSHVSLCALRMKAEGFDHYRCDVNISLGVNTPNLSKILKCAGKTTWRYAAPFPVVQNVTSNYL